MVGASHPNYRGSIFPGPPTTECRTCKSIRVYDRDLRGGRNAVLCIGMHSPVGVIQWLLRVQGTVAVPSHLASGWQFSSWLRGRGRLANLPYGFGQTGTEILHFAVGTDESSVWAAGDGSDNSRRAL